MSKAFRETRQSVAVINASLESSISGIRVTKAFTNDQKELEKFEVGNKTYVKKRSIAYKAMGQFQSSTTFITDLFNDIDIDLNITNINKNIIAIDTVFTLLKS